MHPVTTGRGARLCRPRSRFITVKEPQGNGLKKKIIQFPHEKLDASLRCASRFRRENNTFSVYLTYPIKGFTVTDSRGIAPHSTTSRTYTLLS